MQQKNEAEPPFSRIYYLVRLQLLATFALLVVAGLLAVQAHRVGDLIEPFAAERLAIMHNPHVSRWHDAAGIEHEVSTPRSPSTEGLDEWAARHKAAVAALAAIFPPVVPE